jgi:hypothetical protein
MIGWFVAVLCALFAVWAFSRAHYWKWMWEGERSLNQVLMAGGRTREPRSTGPRVDGVHEVTDGLPRIDTRQAS